MQMIKDGNAFKLQICYTVKCVYSVSVLFHVYDTHTFNILPQGIVYI